MGATIFEQKEGKQLEVSVDAIIQRVQELKNTIASFLMKLENEYETLQWSTVLDNFALLTGQMNSLSRLLKSDKVPSLKNYALLPLLLSQERDPELEKLTEGRVPLFNHEVVPAHLRTKPEPEVEEKYRELITKTMSTTDTVQKQQNTLNKITSNILDIINSAREEWESESSKKSTQPQTSSITDTHSLIAATNFGKGLKQLRRTDVSQQSQQISQQQQQAQQSKVMPQAGSLGKAPSTIKTNIKSASSNHPYQRPT